MRIKCVFQGGGAKLATLIAAAEALEELERDKELEVTEVAGTSAGSIAAYLFAHKKPMAELRARARIAAADAIDHFSRRLSKTEILWKVATGKTFFNEDKLRNFIRSIISETTSDRPTLASGRIPVHVRVADIRHGAKHTFSSGDKNPLPAEEAILHSCAIPFALRSFANQSNSYVDGGIISNLIDPTVFSATNSDASNVIAFSFEKEKPNSFHNLETFLNSLTATVIDNNVEDSIEKIRAMGGEICVLPNHFKTLEFSQALHRGLSDDYIKENKELIKTRIRSALSELGNRARKTNVGQRVSKLNEFCSTVLRDIARRSPYRVVASSIVCVAGGLVPGQTRPDQLIKDVSIEAIGESITAFRIGISVNEAYGLGNDVNCEILDAKGNRHSAIHEVIEAQQDNEKVWQACFYLDKPVAKENTPLRTRLVTTHVGLMKELLKEGGTEWMRTKSQQGDPIAFQDFIFCAPNEAGTFAMVDLLENIHRATQRPSKPQEMKEHWCSGERMLESELVPYRQAYLQLVGHQFIGWRAKNVSPRAYSGVLIERVTS